MIFSRLIPMIVGTAVLLVVLGGCASTSRPYTLGSIRTVDPDTMAIPEPEDKPENELWDRIDMTVVHQLEKPLDLHWTGRQIGRAIGAAGPREADNVNVLGEPPNSSWYTRRHYYREMSPEALARGPNTTGGPASEGTWTIVSGKFEGASPGFVIEDDRGDRYLFKFDRPAFAELSSAAEVISTKILYAAGYHVPENYVVYFNPARLRVGEDAEVAEEGRRRPMTETDVQRMLADLPRTEAGRVRAMASKYVDGRPVGIWEFEGTRDDDPNDRVWHQHRRELRGLRIIGSWINDADRRAANTLAVYTDQRYIKHYLLDMGGTLGSRAGGPKTSMHGYEYLVDPLEITKSTLTLGLYDRPWLFVDADSLIRYPSVGYFEAELFDPGDWVPTHPNPAFEKATLRDAFWGAKIVMSFTDEDLRAIVETGRLTNPAAEAHLLEILKARRDKIGAYWFDRVNPLDRFRIERSSPEAVMASDAEARGTVGAWLRFDDRAVTGGLAHEKGTRYEYSMYHGEQRLTMRQETSSPVLPLVVRDTTTLSTAIRQTRPGAPDEWVVRVEIRTIRADGEAPGQPIDVYVQVQPDRAPRVVGVRRSE